MGLTPIEMGIFAEETGYARASAARDLPTSLVGK